MFLSLNNQLSFSPNLADVVRGLAHLELAGRGVRPRGCEVCVVGGGGAPAVPGQRAAHTEAAGAGAGAGAAERGALGGGVARAVVVAARGVARVVRELDDGEDVEQPRRPAPALLLRLLNTPHLWNILATCTPWNSYFHCGGFKEIHLK